MHFKHLFVFSNVHQISDFFRGLEERTLYSAGYGTGRIHRAYHRLTIMNWEGQHEVTAVTIHDIGNDRYRGLNFDKISVHETVELTWELHEFIQFRMSFSVRGMRIEVDPNLRADEMYMVNNKYFQKFDIKPPEHKGILRAISI